MPAFISGNEFHHPLPELQGKGLGHPFSGLSPAGAAAADWSILNEDVSLPAAVLRQSCLQHNLAWMRDFAAAYGLQLAPHGKTTMSPALFHQQLEAGAWGITLATAPQVQAAYAHGVRRVLMANQLVGKANMALIGTLLRDPDFSFYCVVDSVTNVAALGRHFSASGQRLRVLLEVGVAGGRTGVRDAAQCEAVLQEIARWPEALALTGLETYEGVLKDEVPIRELLKGMVDLLQELRERQAFAEQPVLLSGAGSAWFDVVAEEFAVFSRDPQVEVVLRPGCYLTHDVGAYRDASQRMQASNPIARQLGASLRPALQLWAYVQSRPEPRRVIVGLGKRDAAFDAGMPLPALHHRPGDATPSTAPAHWQVTAMMDQHAFLDVAPHDDLQVGDLLCFDISHPCLTFDKWRHLLVVDDDWRVVDAVHTFF